MNNKLINFSEFEPIINLITSAEFNNSTSTIWLRIAIPRNLDLDLDKCISIFQNDVVLNCKRNECGFMVQITLEGTLLNSELSLFLYNELKKRGQCN